MEQAPAAPLPSVKAPEPAKKQAASPAGVRARSAEVSYGKDPRRCSSRVLLEELSLGLTGTRVRHRDRCDPRSVERRCRYRLRCRPDRPGWTFHRSHH